MQVDWNIVAMIGGPVVAACVGFLLNRALEQRPILIGWLGHATAFRLSQDDGPDIDIFTHSVVVRNSGRRAATNLRLGHNFLPNFEVSPRVNYEIVEMPNDGQELVFSKLLPNEQITISYLYVPPTTWDKINTHLKSDEGFVKIINVLPTPQFPRWANAIAWVLVVLGAITLLYLLFVLISSLVT